MRIPVVDDDEQILQTLTQILIGAGYDVTVAGNGAPHMSGLDLLAKLKADPALASILVAVLSANSDPALVSQATRLAAAAYLVKPVTGLEILWIVQSLLP